MTVHQPPDAKPPRTTLPGKTPAYYLEKREPATGKRPETAARRTGDTIGQTIGLMIKVAIGTVVAVAMARAMGVDI